MWRPDDALPTWKVYCPRKVYCPLAGHCIPQVTRRACGAQVCTPQHACNSARRTHLHLHVVFVFDPVTLHARRQHRRGIQHNILARDIYQRREILLLVLVQSDVRNPSPSLRHAQRFIVSGECVVTHSDRPSLGLAGALQRCSSLRDQRSHCQLWLISYAASE